MDKDDEEEEGDTVGKMNEVKISKQLGKKETKQAEMSGSDNEEKDQIDIKDEKEQN